MILGSIGTHGEVFGTILGMTHSGITHTVHILDITHILHIDHTHTRHIILIILHTTLLLIMVQILTMVLVMVLVMVQMLIAQQMHIAEIIIVKEIQEATQHVLLLILIQETLMAMFLVLQTATTHKEAQTQM